MKKKMLSIILALTLIIGIVPLSAFAATDATVYTEASTSTVYPGDTFTYSISLSGTYDGYSLEFSKEQAGLTIASVTGKAGVFADDRGDTWMLSVMGGLNKVGSAKTKLATVTVSVDVNAEPGTKEIGFTNIAVSNDIGDRATYTTELANVVVISKTVVTTGVALNKESLSLKTGESETLIATVSPDNATNKAVTWDSSDNAIATVDSNGKVTAFKKGTVTITATTEDGNFTDTCEVSVICSHSVTEWVTTTPATHETAGEKVEICSACGETVSTQQISAEGHSFGEWETVKEATCTVEGEEARFCSCGASETRKIDMLAHYEGEWVETIAPNCTENGEEELRCADCGTLLDTREVPALGHTAGEWEEIKAPSCIEIGEETQSCTECGVELASREIAATGHEYGEWVVTTAPTCTEKGVETRECFCGVSETREIAAVGHSIGEYEVIKEATCTASGEECAVCGACGETFTKTIAPLGHTFGEWVVIKDATTDAEGEQERVCSVCGDKEVEAIEKLPVTDDGNDETNENNKEEVNDNNKEDVKNPDIPNTNSNVNTAYTLFMLITLACASFSVLIVYKKRCR